MLAFLDSPVQLLVVGVIVLLVFGPQKLPEIANQLGRALRELKRTTSDLTNSFSMDDHSEPTYNPPRYDSYGNAYDAASSLPTVAEEDVWRAAAPETKSLAAQTMPRGDSAAAALADTESDPAALPAAPAATETTSPVYGVVAPATRSVPRTNPTQQD